MLWMEIGQGMWVSGLWGCGLIIMVIVSGYLLDYRE